MTSNSFGTRDQLTVDGATCAIFPIDQITIDYLRITGRPEQQIRLVETYARAQGLWHEPVHEPAYTQTIELDLGTVEPSIAGPRRPHDRIPLLLGNSIKASIGRVE